MKEACFFDVRWGADIAYCRSKIPYAFFNIRLSPVKIKTCTPDEVEKDLVNLLENAGDLSNVGICCINMDHRTPDENVGKIFEVARRYRSYGGWPVHQIFTGSYNVTAWIWNNVSSKFTTTYTFPKRYLHYELHTIINISYFETIPPDGKTCPLIIIIVYLKLKVTTQIRVKSSGTYYP